MAYQGTKVLSNWIMLVRPWLLTILARKKSIVKPAGWVSLFANKESQISNFHMMDSGWPGWRTRGDGSTPSNRSVFWCRSSLRVCLVVSLIDGPGGRAKTVSISTSHTFWGRYSVNCWSLLFGCFWTLFAHANMPTRFCHTLHDLWWFSVNHDFVSKRFQTGRRKMEERRWGLRQHVTRIPACTTESSWNSQW